MRAVISMIIVTSLFLSCDNEQGQQPKQEVWICYNPASELHGDLCARSSDKERVDHEPCHWIPDSESPTGFSQSPNSFCWQLFYEDCLEVSLEWQKENCHHFND